MTKRVNYGLLVSQLVATSLKVRKEERKMCAPITVTTGGVSGGCVGICQVMPQIIASVGIFGVLIWNFRSSISRALTFRRA